MFNEGDFIRPKPGAISLYHGTVGLVVKVHTPKVLIAWFGEEDEEGDYICAVVVADDMIIIPDDEMECLIALSDDENYEVDRLLN